MNDRSGHFMIDRRRLIRLSAASVLAPAVRAAHAQAWPSRVVRLIVPFSPGGPTDFVARLVAERLTRNLGAQVIIENRGGGGTNIGAELAARATPDGYTVLLGTGALAINRNLYRKLNYDAATDLAPVSLMVILPFFMFVPNSSPARSVAEFVAFAKANRGKIKFGSPGTGTPPHLAGELLKQLAGIEMTHVPYRGASDALNDLIPGRIDLFFASGSTLEQSRAGQIRSLAVSSAHRDDAAPELPAIAETVPGFDVTSWYALFVPAKTPPQIIEKLSADTATALADPTVKGKLEQLGYTVAASTPDELGVQLNWEIGKWGTVIRAAGIGVTE
jgi:tripartite-type tricarboxylate transporter receptor subunit TctC